MEDDRENASGKLIPMHKDTAYEVGSPDNPAGRVQLLLQDRSLFSRVIANLPYPVALFEKSGAVILMNSLLLRQIGIRESDLLCGKINLLDRVTNENYAVFEAVEDVFLGDATVVKDLVSPLTLFGENVPEGETDPYHTAVFFPVGANDVRCGVVMLMV